MTTLLEARPSPSRAAWWGAALAAPAAFFILANLLNDAGVGFLYAALDGLAARFGGPAFNVLSPVVFLGGLGAALALNALAIAEPGVRRDGRRLVFTLSVEPRASNVAVLFVAGLALAALLLYGFVENFRLVSTHAG